ncbi:MAG: hypothetical protein KAQ98_12860 [Bacteriovoracaceae bacterium]|nr:hypothetical protein [Bacteriovoracaceae bacterium]
MKKLVLVFFVMILSTVSMAKVVLKCQSAVSEMPYFEVEVDTKVNVGPVPEPPMPVPLHKSCNYDNFSVEVKKTMDGHHGAITIMKTFEVTDFLLGEESSVLTFENGSLVVVETDNPDMHNALLNISLYEEESEVELTCQKF